MHFATVVSTNATAVHLWRSLGFRIVATVPDGFRWPDGSSASDHARYRALP
jgi:ribosomal protein S18 acetylase RimI-like enzyme